MKQPTGRGEIWLQQLTAGAARLAGLCPSVQVAD
ncbi:MAG TPA: biotin-independent malonate decarboxylase subunit gamma, partial [Erwinia persicina]|nr:biotin-independent malonate decarboxylase subunit gamma [Erwinia persicina]